MASTLRFLTRTLRPIAVSQPDTTRCDPCAAPNSLPSGAPPAKDAKEGPAFLLTLPRPIAAPPNAALKPLQLEPPALSDALGSDARTLWTPRSRDYLRRFFPLFGAPTAGEFKEPLADCPAAAECLKEYLPAAIDALVENPGKPLPFIPATDEIAEYLHPRVIAWAAAVGPRAGVAPILAGCEQRIRLLQDERLLRALISAARAGDVAPSDEIFVRCNLFMAPAADGSRLDWLTAADARWLLLHPFWNEAATRLLAAKAGEAPRVRWGLRLVSGPPQANLHFAFWDIREYVGTTERKGLFSNKREAVGFGVLTWFSGGTYTGTFAHSRRHGWGITVDRSYRYEGEFKDDASNGRGVRTDTGFRHDGVYKNGRANGHGVMTCANGDRLEGEFKDDTLDGRGVMTRANGDRFEGQYKDGKVNGRGVWSYANGDRVEGEYKDGNWVTCLAPSSWHRVPV